MLAIDSYYYTDVHILDSKLVKNAFTRFRVPFYSFCVFNVRSTLSIIIRGCLNSRSGRTLSVDRPLFSALLLTWKKTVLKLKGRRSLGPWQLLWKKPPLEKRVRSQQWDGLQAHSKGSLYISWNLPIYPFPESTLKLASHLGQNVGLGEGRVGSFTKTYFSCTILTDQGLIT